MLEQALRQGIARVEGSHQSFPGHLVGLQDVTCDNDETGVMLGRDLAEPSDHIDMRLAETGRRLERQERPSHAQLPMGYADEADYCEAPI